MESTAPLRVALVVVALSVVPGAAAEDVEALALVSNRFLADDEPAMTVIHDYGGMSLVLVDRDPPEDIASRVHLLPAGGAVGFRSWQTSVPVGVEADAMSGGVLVLALIGPLDRRWREELESAGVAILAPAHPHALVVRTDENGLRRALEIATSEGAPVVLGVVRLPPEARVERSLHPALAGERPGDHLELAVVAGGDSRAQDSLKRAPGGGGVVRVASDDLGRWLVDHPEAMYVEPVWAAASHNNLAARAGNLGVETVWDDLGFNGAGIVVAHNDSGVDLEHPDLAGAVRASVGRMAYTDTGHGTHTAGSIVGRGGGSSPVNTSGCGDVTTPLPSVRGMAWGADLVTNNIFNEGLGDVSEMMRWGARRGALVSGNSWGLTSGTDPVAGYTAAAVAADAAVRDADPERPGDQPLTVFFSAGNLGPGPGTVTSPATAKNVITVGAAENDRCGAWVPDHQPGPDRDAVVTSSGRGPAQGRVKPDLLAPGSDVLSLESADPYATQLWDQPWTGESYALNTGTSQASALAAGAGAIFHEFFWRTRGRRPSPALVKAALINGAAAAHGRALAFDRGWGRIELDVSVLGPANGSVVFFDRDDTAELATGEVWTRPLVVRSSSSPLDLIVVWTDVPGEEDADHPLVNDLDVIVTSPDGTVYRGNVIDAGRSAPDPGPERDGDNNVEVITVADPAPGSWTVEVVAVDVPEAPAGLAGQDFAVVVSGDAGPCAVAPPPPTGLGAVAAGGNRIDIWWSAVPGATRYEVSRSRNASGDPYLPLAVVDAPATSLTDADVSGGISYTYVVRALAECWSGTSVEASATASGECLLPPVFGGLETVIDVQGVSCSLELDWLPAVSPCGSAVVYDVYRSELPGFLPSPADRVAEGVAAAGWLDSGLADGVDYSYLVRARNADGAADDGNLEERMGRPSGPDDVFLDEGGEDGPGDWITIPGSSADRGTGPWTVTGGDSWSGGYAWYVAEEDRIKDQVLVTPAPILIPATGGPVLEFRHRFQLQSRRDGGRLEYSTNGGRDWYDILEGDGSTIPDDSRRFLKVGYVDVIGAPDNPFYLSEAWTGDSLGWLHTVVDLEAFSNRRLLLRWRLGCDADRTLDRGWWLDDIRIVVERPCQSCSPPAPPAGLTATPGSDGIALTWDAVAGAVAYRISRSTTSGGPYAPLALVTPPATSVVDPSGSGGTTYYYVISVETDCRSADSPEVAAEPVGTCNLAPLFWGLDSVADPRNPVCAVDLAWRPAEARCPGSGARYRVYRSTAPAFQPGPEFLIADAFGGLRYRDLAAADGASYFYRVRAVDVGNLAEDDNPVEHPGGTTGPDEALLHDSVEGSIGGWRTGVGSPADSGTEPWTVVDDRAHTGRRSWFCRNEPVVKDRTVGLTEAFQIVHDTTVLSFRQIFDVETFWDGGRLEYSTDSGASWHDILAGDGATVADNPHRFLRGGYGGFISFGTGNPLAGERAWTGFLDDWIETVVDLGDFVGLNVSFRWRFACDRSGARAGWWLDDVELRFTTRCEAAAHAAPRPTGGRRPLSAPNPASPANLARAQTHTVPCAPRDQTR